MASFYEIIRLSRLGLERSLRFDMRKKRLPDRVHDLFEVVWPIIFFVCGLVGLLAFLIGLVRSFNP